MAVVYLLATIGRSWRSQSSAASWLSAYSLLGGSLLSVLSLFSVGSAGSILSIGSAGSILSIGSAGSLLSFGGAGRRGHFRRPARDVRQVGEDAIRRLVRRHRGDVERQRRG